MMAVKVAFVTTLQPETHYSRYLIEALESCGKITLLIYTDKDPRNSELEQKNLKLVWTPTSFFPFQIATQAFLDRPTIVHVQHEISMYGGPFTAVFFPLLLLFLRFISRKTIVTIHSVVPRSQIDTEFMHTFSWPKSETLARALRVVFSFLYRSVVLLADKVIVHSNYMAGLLKNDYNVRREKIAVIPIGVPAPKIKKDAMISSNHPWASQLDDKRVILYFGYIIRRKGLEYLIEAFQSIYPDHPDCILVLAGGELDYQRGYTDSLLADLKRSGQGNAVAATSFISEEEIEQLYARCEFVVLPYIYSISSSLPLSFAMQYGKPVIATRLGTLAEEVDDGVNGLLVPPRDAPALANAMLRLITDSDLQRRLSEGSQSKALQRSWSNVAALTMSVYGLI